MISSLLLSQINNESLISTVSSKVESKDSLIMNRYIDSAINISIENKETLALKADLLWKDEKLIENYDSILYYYNHALAIDSACCIINYNIAVLYNNLADIYKHKAANCIDIEELYDSLVNEYNNFIYSSKKQLIKVSKYCSLDSNIIELQNQIDEEYYRIKVYQKKLIEDTGKMLNGKWILESYETSNMKETYEISDNKYIVNISEHDSSYSEQVEGIDIITFSFDKHGFGEYSSISNYPILNKDYEVIVSCQPVPELIIKDSKVVIHMTGMVGEYIIDIVELNDNDLILHHSYGEKCKYKRFKQ